MAEQLNTDPLTEDQFAVLKMYCKVDNTVEDDLLMQLVHDAGSEIATAIRFGSTPEDFLTPTATRDRFFAAMMRQVKEEYDYRGEGAEVMRYPLLTPVAGIVNQLRTETGDADAND
ncbi:MULTISPECIES: head-tail connector protein [Lacticaseibacillus]|uniref:Head-tail connector protein n=1 Tax=Lacticaseibacillus yichunensis TaxID=2486015 RepID=A0ABW4CP44_9LACO|nr:MULTISPECIES: head-tail connector protein [Lacticaseibacillus]